MQSKATTVEQYLRELPDDRRQAISAVRSVILKHLPKGLKEEMSYGMIGYVVPHARYPPGYHCDPKLPLPYANLASQKNHMALYLMTGYQLGGWLKEQFEARGKKLDMGKGCIRFRKLEDLPLDVVAEAFERVPVDKFIEFYESTFKSRRKRA